VISRRDPLADPKPLIRRVYAYVAYRIGDGRDAEDVTSEVFERALRYRDSYDRTKGDPAAWLIGIAQRVLAQHLQPTIQTVELHDVASPVQLEDDAVRRLGLAAAIASLDERDRHLIALHYGADLTPREIGEILGLRTNAVEVALHRARNRLSAKLRDGQVHEAEAPTRQRTV
jgi:RNA polymerase sigma factor (sigma-70 family)